MSNMSYLSSIERYHEYRDAIRQLLASILTGISRSDLVSDPAVLKQVMCEIREHYKFVSLIYTLDKIGVQSSENVDCGLPRSAMRVTAIGLDRSQRPYYLLAKESDTVVITEPYLSSVGRNLCLSAAVKLCDANGDPSGYLVLDIDLAATIDFFMGDVTRRRFVPFFQSIYILIVIGLFVVVGVLIYAAFSELQHLFAGEMNEVELHLKPFGVIIFLTLGLAVFDLGKTILEEEVLMRKDIFRHSSTRRTITRFIASILIAISIEGLLMIFRAAVTDSHDMRSAVWMMFAAVSLLVGLGIYVFLGAKAEVALLGGRQPK